MKVRIISLLLLLAVFVAAFKPVSGIYTTKSGKISFRSDAPLELIRVSSDRMYGKFNPQTKDFAFNVRIRTFKGFNSAMQEEHFNENYLESDKYPYAGFSGKIIEDVDYMHYGSVTVRAKGNLTIHNVAQERIIKVVLKISEEGIDVRSGFTVLLSEHNIPVPKVVHEKIASEIKVEVNATMAKE